MLPTADHLWATDHRWWTHWIETITRDYDGQCWTVRHGWPNETPPEAWGVQAFEADVGARGLSRDPKVINTNCNGGAAAINLAYHLMTRNEIRGAKRILLLGYDMQMEGDKRHWFGDHPGNLSQKSDYANFAGRIASIVPEQYGMEIWNVTRRTALNCFPIYDLDEVVCALSSSAPATACAA